MAASNPGVRMPEGWRVEGEDERASVEVKTRDFVHAVEVVTRIRDIAERLNHHPDVHLERWNHLRIVTYSHDAGHLTERDARLAAEIDAVFAKDGLKSV